MVPRSHEPLHCRDRQRARRKNRGAGAKAGATVVVEYEPQAVARACITVRFEQGSKGDRPFADSLSARSGSVSKHGTRRSPLTAELSLDAVISVTTLHLRTARATARRLAGKARFLERRRRVWKIGGTRRKAQAKNVASPDRPRTPPAFPSIKSRSRRVRFCR